MDANFFTVTTFSDIDPDLWRIILMVGIPYVVINLILFITALVSIVKKKVPAGDKVLWIVITFFIDIIGPIIYFAVGANMLDQKAAQLEDGGNDN